MSSTHKSTPATRDAQPTSLLARITETPQLARLVPYLPADTLQRLIAHCGVHDCAELVALVTPAQLKDVLDIDLWRSPRPGLDEQLDPSRFTAWLEVLLETGPERAAHMVAQLDPAVVTAGFAHNLRVFDPAIVAPVEIDGEEIAVFCGLNMGMSCEIGGYLIVARDTDAWDAIVAILIALDSDEPECFHEVMRGCRRLSNSAPEIDGLDNLSCDREQHTFDVADARERRRGRQGYISAHDAQAFLEVARQSDPVHGITSIAAAHLRELEPDAADAPDDAATGMSAAGESSAPPEASAAMSSLVEILADAGVMQGRPRALLGTSHGEVSPTASFDRCLAAAFERDEAIGARRMEEVAFLANALMAGCSLQGRSFTRDEASQAAIAVCNLGLERWTRQHGVTATRRVRPATDLPDDFLIGHDAIGLFASGWRVLYTEVCLPMARRLIDVLDLVVCTDQDIQRELRALQHRMRQQLAAGTPWHEAESLDAVMSLDMSAWAGLVGLLGECPVLHAVVAPPGGKPPHRIEASAFEFIAGTAQLERIHAFMRELPELLQR